MSLLKMTNVQNETRIKKSSKNGLRKPDTIINGKKQIKILQLIRERVEISASEETELSVTEKEKSKANYTKISKKIYKDLRIFSIEHSKKNMAFFKSPKLLASF